MKGKHMKYADMTDEQRKAYSQKQNERQKQNRKHVYDIINSNINVVISINDNIVANPILAEHVKKALFASLLGINVPTDLDKFKDTICNGVVNIKESK